MDPPFPPDVPEPAPDDPPVVITEMGLVGSLEAAPTTLVRSSVVGPELRC